MSRLTFFCDLAEATIPLPHFWEHTVGSDHAPMALRADWQQQLQQCHNELGFKYVRFHGLLSDDMGTLVLEDNKPLYSFLNIDQVFDFREGREVGADGVFISNRGIRFPALQPDPAHAWIALVSISARATAASFCFEGS